MQWRLSRLPMLGGLAILATAPWQPYAVSAQELGKVELMPIALPTAEQSHGAYQPAHLSASPRPTEGPLRAVISWDDRTPILASNIPGLPLIG
ncbi:MAG: hypothetical protein ACFBSG_03500 [Leptolyngbyaceae cyanobacterium]